MLVSCAFLIGPSLKQALEASQQGKEKNPTNGPPDLGCGHQRAAFKSKARLRVAILGSQWVGLGSSGLTGLVLHVQVSYLESWAGRRIWRNHEILVRSFLVLLGKTLSSLSTAVKAFFLNRETGASKKTSSHPDFAVLGGPDSS